MFEHCWYINSKDAVRVHDFRCSGPSFVLNIVFIIGWPQTTDADQPNAFDLHGARSWRYESARTFLWIGMCVDIARMSLSSETCFTIWSEFLFSDFDKKISRLILIPSSVRSQDSSCWLDLSECKATREPAQGLGLDIVQGICTASLCFFPLQALFVLDLFCGKGTIHEAFSRGAQLCQKKSSIELGCLWVEYFDH